MLVLIYEYVVSGLIVGMHFLIQGFFIPTHQAIVPGAYHLCIDNLRRTKRGSTVSESTQSSTDHLLLLSFQHVVEWEE